MAAVNRANLTEDLVIDIGGWHRAFARVVLVIADDDVAIALVDGNGDGAELEMEYWNKTPEGWVSGSSSGYGPLGTSRSTNRWDAGSMVCVVGKGAVPGETVRLGYGDEIFECAVNHYGLWGFVRKVDGMNVKHPLPELLDEDAATARVRRQREASMDLIRERLRGKLKSRRPPTV